MEKSQQCSAAFDGRVRPLKADHIWTIGAFRAKLENCEPGDAIISPTFFIGGSGDLQGRLVLYPKGQQRAEESSCAGKYVSVFLYLDSRERQAVRARLRCSLLTKRREELACCRAVHEFKRGQGYGFPGFVARSLLVERADEILVDDSLLLQCAVTLAPEKRPEGPVGWFFRQFLTEREDSEKSEDGSAKKQDVNVDGSSSNLKQLLDNEFSDIILSSQGTEFRAHRQILAAHSAVFSVMFMRQSEENLNNRLELDELQPEVLREMLRFIYTGKVDNVDLVPGLLVAAINYGLGNLKSLCEQILFSTLNIDNVFGILILADQHKIVQLKKYALNIITLYARTVVKTPGFQKLKESKRTDLMAEAFCALALAQNS